MKEAVQLMSAVQLLNTLGCYGIVRTVGIDTFPATNSGKGIFLREIYMLH